MAIPPPAPPPPVASPAAMAFQSGGSSSSTAPPAATSRGAKAGSMPSKTAYAGLFPLQMLLEPAATPGWSAVLTSRKEPAQSPRSSDADSGKEAAASAPPAAKGNGVIRPPGKRPGAPPKAPPPKGKAPPLPKGKAPFGGRTAGWSPAAGRHEGSLPAWSGPQPTQGWKADCVVNWQPIRQTARLEGSVWAQVQASREHALEPVFDGLEDPMNQAFMSNVSAPAAAPRSPRGRRRSSKQQVVRRFGAQKAFEADIKHAQLVRQGYGKTSSLCWATGSNVKREGERDVIESRAESGELSGEVLQLLLELLCCGEGEKWLEVASESASPASDESVQKQNSTEGKGAPSEEFLVGLLREAGPLKELKSKVEMAYHIARFNDKAQLEPDMQKALKAIRGVLDSRCMPVLLEGVLLVGNYVNSASSTLGGALGITLDSLAKLAHTRGRNSKGGKNPLMFLIEHLQKTQPSFMETLAKDLQGCVLAKDVDPRILGDALKILVCQVKAIEKILEASKENGRINSEALEPDRLRDFLVMAWPKVSGLQELMSELETGIGLLRRWFAESPDARFQDMMRSLTSLYMALPTHRHTKDLKRNSRKVVAMPGGQSEQEFEPALDLLKTALTQIVTATGRGVPKTASGDAAAAHGANTAALEHSLIQLMSVMSRLTHVNKESAVSTGGSDTPFEAIDEAAEEEEEANSDDDSLWDRQTSSLQSLLGRLASNGAEDTEGSLVVDASQPLPPPSRTPEDTSEAAFEEYAAEDNEGRFGSHLAILEQIMPKAPCDGSASGLSGEDSAEDAEEADKSTCGETEDHPPNQQHQFDAHLAELTSVLGLLGVSDGGEKD
eukprot:TRINITY_DN41778_c0_g1_i1.p1 TRINITY_DN41778_c0_g1~~TRINITY_DN41778_c0_g1_i1.p1  ORF type:complete len:839 (+),score=237.44 TRINITY_DN41778_c0_g1_i1:114-2630(+)